MRVSLPLDKMTKAEKISAMEQLWDDLCRTPKGFSSPAWHRRVLAARERRIQKGRARLSDIEVVGTRLRKQAR